MAIVWSDFGTAAWPLAMQGLGFTFWIAIDLVRINPCLGIESIDTGMFLGLVGLTDFAFLEWLHFSCIAFTICASVGLFVFWNSERSLMLPFRKFTRLVPNVIFWASVVIICAFGESARRRDHGHPNAPETVLGPPSTAKPTEAPGAISAWFGRLLRLAGVDPFYSPRLLMAIYFVECIVRLVVALMVLHKGSRSSVAPSSGEYKKLDEQLSQIKRAAIIDIVAHSLSPHLKSLALRACARMRECGDAVGEGTGSMFQMPHSLQKILGDTLLVHGSNAPVSPEGLLKEDPPIQAIGLYFSKEYDTHCRSMDPQLIKWYNQGLRLKGLEIVLISDDTVETKFQHHFAGMPWKAVPFAETDLRNHLYETYEVHELPALVVIDTKARVIVKDGLRECQTDPTGDWVSSAAGPVQQPQVKGTPQGS